MLYSKLINDSNILNKTRGYLNTLSKETYIPIGRLSYREGRVHCSGELRFNYDYQGRLYKNIDSCDKIAVTSPYSEYTLLPNRSKELYIESAVIHNFIQLGDCDILRLNWVIAKSPIGVQSVNKVFIDDGSYSSSFKISTDSKVDDTFIRGASFQGVRYIINSINFS